MDSQECLKLSDLLALFKNEGKLLENLYLDMKPFQDDPHFKKLIEELHFFLNLVAQLL